MSLATMYYSYVRDVENKFVRLRSEREKTSVLNERRSAPPPIFIATGG